MMQKRNSLKIQGALLRIERLKQNKGQKEVCYGICVPSYLSKIEHGAVEADEEIVKQLFARLGIGYQTNTDTLSELRSKMDLYYSNISYALDTQEVYIELKKFDETLQYSNLVIDWLLIQGMEKRLLLPYLQELEFCMDEKQKAYYSILCFWSNPEAEEAKEWCTYAVERLNNCFAYMQLIEVLYLQDNYAAIHQLENRFTAIALEEGNTYYLAAYYFMKGSAYASLNMDEMMMECYQKGIHLLQNTNWVEELGSFYYNIGATYINLKKYEEAIYYLGKTTQNSMTYHKLALAHIRGKNLEKGKEFLEKMKNALFNENANEAEWLRYEEAVMECEKDFLESPEYLELLEKLLRALEKNYPFGHMFFYKDVAVEAYKRQRKYKKALEFENKISSKAIKSSV